MLFRLALCDDEIACRRQLVSFLQEYEAGSALSFTYTTFRSGLELMAALEDGAHFDAYCLDIVMPGMDGIELGREIRKKDTFVPILYLTSSPEFALDSYAVKAADYLLKPLVKERFFEALDTLLEHVKCEEEDFFTIKENTCIHKVLLSNLVYAEAMGRKVIYHLVSGRILESSCRFSETCDTLLSFPCFIKPHRSYVVNMNYIKSIEQSEILLLLPDCIPIAQGHAKKVKDSYLTFLMTREEIS